MPDTPTPRALLLLALGDAIEYLDGLPLDARGRLELRERLAEQLRLVETRQIGDLTRTRAAEQAAFEQGWKMAREAAVNAASGYESAAQAVNAIRALPMPERGT